MSSLLVRVSCVKFGPQMCCVHFYHIATLITLFNFCFCSCERCRIDNFYSLDGGGLPPLAALFPARQSQAELGFLVDLFPVELAADRSSRGSCCPVYVCSGRVHRGSLSDSVVRLRGVGVEAGDGLHGQQRRRVALPGHRRAHLVLQLVQRGRGSDSNQEFYLPSVHDHGWSDPAGNVVVLQRTLQHPVI